MVIMVIHRIRGCCVRMPKTNITFFKCLQVLSSVDYCMCCLQDLYLKLYTFYVSVSVGRCRSSELVFVVPNLWVWGWWWAGGGGVGVGGGRVE